PKLASHVSFNFDPDTLSHFQLNVIRGCNPVAGDQSFRMNPKQVNLIVPSTSVPPSPDAIGPNCGAEAAFAVTYGGGYAGDKDAITSPYPGIGTIRPVSGASSTGCDGDYACFADGTRAFSTDDWLIDMFHSGADEETAEWAARLKGHFTIAELGGD